MNDYERTTFIILALHDQQRAVAELDNPDVRDAVQDLINRAIVMLNYRTVPRS